MAKNSNLDFQVLEQFFELSSFDDIAKLLEIDPHKLRYLLYGFPSEKKYSRFYISKKSGDFREILHPDLKLKNIQHKLKRVLHEVYNAPVNAHGFIPSRSIVTNAEIHANSMPRYILNLDLQDFFPSINFGRVQGMFKAIPYNLPDRIATIIAQICCFENMLPQGAPTSPIISNMICVSLDRVLNDFAYNYRCIYTRYADDITFSTTSKKGFLPDFVGYDSLGKPIIGTKLQQIIEESGFTINTKKFRLQNLNSKQEVTGLIINSHKPNVKRDYVRQIRAMFHAWEKYGLEAAQKEFLDKYDTKRRNPWNSPPSFQKVVRGKIEFVGMVRGHDDILYNKLLTKFKELMGIPCNSQTSLTQVHNKSKEHKGEDQQSNNSLVYTDTTNNRVQYTEFSNEKFIPAGVELLLKLNSNNECDISVLQPENAETDATVSLPYTHDELIAILKLLSNRYTGKQSLKSEQVETLAQLGLLVHEKPIPNLEETIGRKLYEAIFPDQIGEYFRCLLKELKYSKRPIRLTLKFSGNAVSLSQYPWELVHDNLQKGQPLLLSGAIHLIRYIRLPQQTNNHIPLQNLNVLYIESRPNNKDLDNLPTNDDNQEYSAVQNALYSTRIDEHVDFHKLTFASFENFQEYLSTNNVNILHFDGHGKLARLCPNCEMMNYPHYIICQNDGCGYSIDHVDPLGYLAFQDSTISDAIDWVSSNDLRTLLSNYNINLAVLSACQSGETRGRSVFGSVGPSLIQAGIPAVVAMQLAVTHNSSSIFMKAFYDAIIRGESLSEAVRQGRQMLLRNPEWFVPVVYSRGNSSHVPFFQIPRKRKDD